MTMIKRATIPNPKVSLAVKQIDCPHCGAKKVNVMTSDKKCPKCGKTIKLEVVSESK